MKPRPPRRGPAPQPDSHATPLQPGPHLSHPWTLRPRPSPQPLTTWPNGRPAPMTSRRRPLPSPRLPLQPRPEPSRPVTSRLRPCRPASHAAPTAGSRTPHQLEPIVDTDALLSCVLGAPTTWPPLWSFFFRIIVITENKLQGVRPEGLLAALFPPQPAEGPARHRTQRPPTPGRWEKRSRRQRPARLRTHGALARGWRAASARCGSPELPLRHR